MVVSKDKFIYYVNKYKDAYAEQARFQDALRPFFDFPVCTYLSSFIDSYEQLLVDLSECYEEDAIFSWWVQESPNDDKIIKVKHLKTGEVVEYDVTTAEGLYNYLYAIYHGKKDMR